MKAADTVASNFALKEAKRFKVKVGVFFRVWMVRMPLLLIVLQKNLQEIQALSVLLRNLDWHYILKFTRSDLFSGQRPGL
jgi:hypothetical protein